MWTLGRIVANSGVVVNLLERWSPALGLFHSGDSFGRNLVMLFQPWANAGRAIAWIAVWVPLATELTPANVADPDRTLMLLHEAPPGVCFILGDTHYNDPLLRRECEFHGRLLVAIFLCQVVLLCQSQQFVDVGSGIKPLLGGYMIYDHGSRSQQHQESRTHPHICLGSARMALPKQRGMERSPGCRLRHYGVPTWIV
jgi:hypothetical protein